MIGLEYIVKENKISYREIARQVGVSPPVINDWVGGRRKIPSKRLEQLSEIFDLPEAYFLKELTASEKVDITIKRLKDITNTLETISKTEITPVDYDKLKEDSELFIIKQEYDHWKANIENSNDIPMTRKTIEEIQATSFAEGFVSAINKSGILG